MRAHALYCVLRRESAAMAGGIDAAWSSEGEGRWITVSRPSRPNVGTRGVHAMQDVNFMRTTSGHVNVCI